MESLEPVQKIFGQSNNFWVSYGPLKYVYKWSKMSFSWITKKILTFEYSLFDSGCHNIAFGQSSGSSDGLPKPSHSHLTGETRRYGARVKHWVEWFIFVIPQPSCTLLLMDIIDNFMYYYQYYFIINIIIITVKPQYNGRLT